MSSTTNGDTTPQAVTLTWRCRPPSPRDSAQAHQQCALLTFL